MTKRPWFKFYTADWVFATSGMTLEEQGAYMRLLAFQWNEGAISGQPKRVALKLGVSPDHYDSELRAMVETHFLVCADGKHRNPRLERERQQVEAESLSNSINGRVRAAAGERNGNGQYKGSSAGTSGQSSEKPAFQSQKSESESTQKKQRQKAHGEPTPVFQVVEAWRTGWAERFKPVSGRAPEPNDADWKQAKNLLAAHTLDESLALVIRFLDDTDKFVAERGHMLRDLPSRLARYAKGNGPLFSKTAPLAPMEPATESRTETL